MKVNEYRVIGLMSGTSLDGIDLVLVSFQFQNEAISYKIEQAETLSYPKNMKHKLKQAIFLEEKELEALDIEYTRYLAEILRRFITKNSIKKLDAVCSHGHTVKHAPEKGLTLQIGNRQELARLISQKVVCNFRVQDVLLGGQGAPLVPIGDQLLFPQYRYCLNLGGFANISTLINGQRLAYDICAVNTVLNHYAAILGKEYDENGKIAASGTFNKELYTQLNALEFFQQKPPKSLGIEWVNEKVLPITTKFEADIPSILHSFSAHVAFQVARALDNNTNSEVLVTGGGTFNNFLLKKFREYSSCTFQVPKPEIVDFKEALVFALLGVLKLRGEVNVLKSVTGAQRDHSSGKVFLP